MRKTCNICNQSVFSSWGYVIEHKMVKHDMSYDNAWASTFGDNSP